MMEDSGPNVTLEVSGALGRNAPLDFYGASDLDEGPHDTATGEKNRRCAVRRERASMNACLCRHRQMKCQSHPGFRRLQD